MKEHSRLLFIPQPKTLQRLGWGFAVVFLVLLLFLGWKKGPSQYGNILSFVGSLALIIPPVRQALTNGIFHAALKTSVTPPQGTGQLNQGNTVEGRQRDELNNLDKKIEQAKAKGFMIFSWIDVGFYLGGAFLLACGFLVSILSAVEKQT
jgi:hypothetical protein